MARSECLLNRREGRQLELPQLVTSAAAQQDNTQGGLTEHHSYVIILSREERRRLIKLNEDAPKYDGRVDMLAKRLLLCMCTRALRHWKTTSPYSSARAWIVLTVERILQMSNSLSHFQASTQQVH